VIVLVPAYEPDEKLVRLVQDLRSVEDRVHVLVVNDGSGPGYDPIFAKVAALGCTVIGHHPNRGKGYALKRGFAFAAKHHPGHDVVCADCDGQHSVVDILRVARTVEAERSTIILGSRRFTGRVPFASRFGNSATRVAFARSTGHRLYDTQTGLRGYPASMLPWLQTVEGDRFEYELDLLLHAERDGIAIEELPIETIYLEGNASSHFRPLVDSARVYAPLVKFSLSSLGAFVLDAVMLFVLLALTGDLLVAVVGARAVSSTCNFVMNRWVVFAHHGRGSLRSSAVGYFGLVAAIVVVNYGLLALLHEVLGMNLVPAKLVTEAVLFAVSYNVQRRVVFRRSGAQRLTYPPSMTMDSPDTQLA
jgi:glycosyltransferase involved in cell wall biosynthesis